MSGNMTVMQYARKFMELSRFTPDFMGMERMKMRWFEEGLSFYVRNQLAGQPIQTYQELYERVAEVERVKGELRVLNPENQKMKWNDCRTSSESVAQKKPFAGPDKSRLVTSKGPCVRCGWTNHTTAECYVGTNKCIWCGNPEHSIVNCSKRQRLWKIELQSQCHSHVKGAYPWSPQRQDEPT